MILTARDKKAAKRGYVGKILVSRDGPLWGRKYRGKEYL
jgi:hypothetical protein